MPDEARAMLDEVQVLAGAIRPKLDRVVRGLRWYRWFAAFLILVVATLANLGILTYRNASCNESYSNASRGRTDRLTILSTARQDALDRLLRDVFAHPGLGLSSAVIRADAGAYLKTSDVYNRGLHDNPIPQSPANNCALF